MHSHIATNFCDLRRIQKEILFTEELSRQQEIGVVEQQFPVRLGATVGELYGINGTKRHESLLHAAVWALYRHPHIEWPKEVIAQYLNLTLDDIEYYLFSAEVALRNGPMDDTCLDMLRCFERYGPTTARELSKSD